MGAWYQDGLAYTVGRNMTLTLYRTRGTGHEVMT
jgi:hypothetical protein